jgi:hypothetical protein
MRKIPVQSIKNVKVMKTTLTALSKSKKHFVGLTWATGNVKGGFAQCDKNDYRGALAGLDGVTGKKAVDSEAMTIKN